MDIKYSKNTERPVAEIVKEQFSLAINKAAGEYDRNLTDIVLAVGDEYKVKHNGSEYTCTAWAEDGKVHIGGEGEPFDIYNFDGDIYAMAQQGGHNKFEVYHEKMNGLPYEAMPIGYPGVKTEMVEIVPEQSVTAQRVSTSCQATLPIFAEIGKQYIVKINGTTYKCEAKSNNGIPVMGDQTTSNFVNYPFNLRCDGKGYHHWAPELGKTIILAIYEEKEVVKPMNAKFADIIISNEDGVFSCNTTYAELRKMCEIDPLSIVNVKYVEKRNSNTEIKLTVKQLKNLEIYETQFMFEFGDYNSSTVVLYNSNGTIGTAGPV